MKYKLKKWYPCLPIWWKDSDNIILEKLNGAYHLEGETFKTPFKEQTIQNNPEFWEEIIEKKPEFKTEDGIDVFEGDVVFWITDFKILYPLICVKSHKNLLSVTDSVYKVFSAREKAEEHIIENKPSISLKDFWSFVSMLDTNFDQQEKIVTLGELLKGHVKNKLKS